MREKPLFALALALLSGLIFGEAFLFFPITLSCFALMLLLLEARVFRSRLISLGLLCVWALGFLLHQFGASPQAHKNLKKYVDQGKMSVIAQIAAPLRHGKKHVSLRMKILSIASDSTFPKFTPVSGVFQLFIWDKNVHFEYGDQLEMQIKLRRAKQYQNPGSFLYADYHKRIGWQATASLSDATLLKKIGEGGNPLLKKIYGWREDIRKKILMAVDTRTAAILLAMIIGESGGLDDEMRENFIAAGIAHLLAVSGTHLAFIALFVFFCTKTLILYLPETLLLKCTSTKIPSQWAALFTAITISLYALLAGGRIGTLRALCMALVYLFSIWLGRSRNPLNSLALAALLILLAQPPALFEISFQLSFLAVLSIILFMAWWKNAKAETTEIEALQSRFQNILKKCINTLQFLFLSSFSAAIGTAPLTLYYFHQLAWVGLFSNIVLIPIVGWILLPFSLISALASFFMTGFPLPEWHTKLWHIFNQIVEGFAALPGAGTHFAAPPLWLISLFYVSFFFLLITQKSRKILFTSLGIFFTIFVVFGSLRFPPENLRITFLDVGQGDAALVEFPNGKTLLIDGGDRRAGKYALAPYLWQHRIKKIDLLIVTHPQFDHIGGLPFILQKFKVDTVLSTGENPTSEIEIDFQEMLDKTGVKHHILEENSPALKISNCQLFFLPAFQEGMPRRKDLNNRSIVFKLQCPQKKGEPVSILFTGDIETEREQQLLAMDLDLRSTVLKVPHHGSRSSSQKAFIAAVAPKIAVFSLGQKNRYRHPHATIVDRYEASNIQLLRTDQAGAVFIETGSEIKISTFVAQQRKKILWNKTIFAQEWENIQKIF
ncbi:MAG: DNA internalization-related competence protein ComEC/Rec2 [Nitrospirae bacterium]|nr:DNA internalization-related competence protein ComEC/Rec2 [Candidatus Manganitrophaceae bacterium]